MLKGGLNIRAHWYYLLRCSVSEVEASVSPSHSDVSLEDLLVLEGLLLLDEMLELEPTVHSSSDTPVWNSS